MRPSLLVAIVLLFSNAVTVFPLHGQTMPVVAFILENDWLTASVADPGPDGISRVAEIFRRLGAQTRIVQLNEPLPEEAKVVILVRPLRNISADALARLWRHIEKGNNFLLTIDPIGYPEERTEASTGGLGRLLTTDYGVSFRDTFLAEPWFTNNTVADIEGSIVRTYADSLLPHPVIEPLVKYQVPVYVRGARTVRTEPFGISSFGYPLLLTNSAYGETTREVFTSRGVPPPLQLNLGVDEVGTLVVAGLGENVSTGSRIAVLGDTALVQNGFGLEQIVSDTGEETPRFPGNRILVERIAAWLLNLPLEEWPGLPEGFTWLELDGDSSDWSESQRVIADEDDNQSATPELDIQQVRAFRNNDFLYLLIETSASPLPSARLRLQLQNTTSGDTALSLRANEILVVDGENEFPVPDAQFAVAQAMEILIPLRVVGIERELTIEELCIWEGDSPADANPVDCLSETISLRRLNERAPANLQFPDGPLVIVTNPGSTGTNLRTGPGTNFLTLTTLANGTILVGHGRNEVGDWVYVENARYGGWMSASLVTSNAELSLLPIIEQ
jgi:hypothetical protein